MDETWTEKELSISLGKSGSTGRSGSVATAPSRKTTSYGDHKAEK